MKYNVFVNYLGDGGCSFHYESDSIVEQVLEDVFAMFNYGSGKESPLFMARKLRSLSVHDCVRVGEQWYQCASVGWQKVTAEYVDELEKKVVMHPLFKLHGSFFALNDIMWTEYKKI